ncbi:hypothetical protein DL93DRAFT_2167363 [Clavulina sp. PMI_390]|nr:hypothetical protein DL93DRAFT_2167363 [Clavulina sp. PMI_390]
MNAATQPGGVSSPPPAPAPVIDDPKVNAMNHLPTHPFVPAGIKKCDLCGATVKFAFHCKICPNYDECEACHNRLTIPVAIVQATVITTHEPHHGFDLREGLQKCGPCGKNLSDRKALRCKICPDYNECINCFNGIKVVQATATTQQRPAAKNEGLSTLAQVAETIKNQHETMENAQNMVQGLNNIMTIINNLSNN